MASFICRKIFVGAPWSEVQSAQQSSGQTNFVQYADESSTLGSGQQLSRLLVTNLPLYANAWGEYTHHPQVRGRHQVLPFCQSAQSHHPLPIFSLIWWGNMCKRCGHSFEVWAVCNIDNHGHIIGAPSPRLSFPSFFLSSTSIIRIVQQFVQLWFICHYHCGRLWALKHALPFL